MNRIDDHVVYAAMDGFWAGLIPAAILAPFIYRLLIALKSRQTVSQYVPDHQAKQGTPTMGGLIIVAGLLLYYLPVGRTMEAWWGVVMQNVWRYVLIIGFTAIGFLDDYVVPKLIEGKRGLGWVPKLVMQFAVAAPWAWWSSGGSVCSCAIRCFVIVAFSNAFNFADGMDALAGGLAILLALGFAILAALNDGHSVTLCMVLIGAMLPFLYYNAPPAKVFMGDVGSLPVGATLGVIAIGSIDRILLEETRPQMWLLAVAVMCLVLAAELIPVPLQILSVKLRKKKLFPMTPIHHAFQAAGWPETRVVAMFHIVQAFLIVVALTMFVKWSGAIMPTLGAGP